MPRNNTKSEKTKTLLDRGVDTIYPSRSALEKRLAGGKPLKVYLGIDPTGAEIHLGHTIALQKLRHFQELGHEVTLVIGDFTGQTGDPTDKAATRRPLTKAEVLTNAKSYQRQAAAILKFDGPNPVKLTYNSQWLEKLDFADVAELAGHFTVQQMIERDMFEERLKAGKPISLREFLYPLMQGYDSVAQEVDVEVGGTDQTFNMLAGRKLAKEYLGKEKFVVTTPLLADSTGKKVGKTEGNVIAIAGKPEELYGQVMALPDEVIVPVLEWCTNEPKEQIAHIKRLAKTDPMTAKMGVASSLVSEYQGKSAAIKAQDRFIRVHVEKSLPEKPPKWKAPRDEMRLWDLVRSTGLVASSSEARRLIQQKAVRIHGGSRAGEFYTDNPDFIVDLSAEPILQVGKKKFLQVTRPSARK